MKETSEGYMKKLSRSFVVLVVMSLFLGLNSCATGKNLNTAGAKNSDVTGTFTLILYGCGYHGDMTTVAILAKEDTHYPFEVFAPEFMYKIKKNMPAEEALKEAEGFISCSVFRTSPSLRKILDGEGNTIGYELRPKYWWFSDVLDISYIMNGKVNVIIRLKQEVERQLSS
jgi:hypothetical protein